ncbi:extracellular catalytic domain type 1 short-chain-length polyhydroxyalkanoate depolymerase [Puniceibacterium confluentis]|uniref:extracellular catalytic domain type 1 short-chain-length polyhydroxyalkanoate depolymerase n=1 Tax=Puniceibacterium confluentis TaxID=1958944 RepID=UPI0011B7153A|nr:PHB depolymerase family esterase [Puniceibacterium confluentis]
MKKLDDHTPLGATTDTWSHRLSAARDLVQRTLAQHGLSGGSDVAPSAPAGNVMQDMMAKLQRGLGAGHPSPAPGGASADMQHGTFTCAAGQRDYRLYVPESHGKQVTGLIVMLHGCTQTPEDFAAGTGMNALAARHRLAVLYPEQSRGSNAQSCWNWFSPGDQRRDRGEPAILSGMTQKVAQQLGVPAEQTYVAGLSAGAAMAVILGETYPDVFAAVGAHSGLPMGAARDVASAFAAMAGSGADTTASATGSPTVPTIIFHGTADTTVHPVNGARIFQRARNGDLSQSRHEESSGSTGGRDFKRATVTGAGGGVLLDHWVVDGLAHAWSGGQAAGSYTDGAGPDASAEMLAFFLQTKGIAR